MDALTQKKIAEAKQHVADAEKSMKTSLFKRKPDLDSAADSYQKAGSCYKIAKDINQAVQCFTKAADYYAQNDSLYNAAKQHEQVGFLANDLKNYTLLADSFEKAAELMITGNIRDSAGIMLERGANMLKLTAPEKALRLLKRAIQIAEVEDKHHELMTFYDSASNLAIRIKDYNQAIELMNGSLQYLERVGTVEQIVKCVLTVIILHFSRDDWICAQSYWENMKSKYQMTNQRIEELLRAYDEKDDDKFKETIKNYLSYAVDNEVLKIANAIVKSDDWLKAISAQTGPVAQNPKAVLPPPPPPPPSVYVQPEQVAVEVKQSAKASEIESTLEALELQDEPKQAAPQAAAGGQKEQTDDEEDEFDLL